MRVSPASTSQLLKPAHGRYDVDTSVESDGIEHAALPAQRSATTFTPSAWRRSRTAVLTAHTKVSLELRCLAWSRGAAACVAAELRAPAPAPPDTYGMMELSRFALPQLQAFNSLSCTASSSLEC